MMLLTFFFFFNDTATTEIYTLSLHDALPIYKKKAFAEVSLAAYVPHNYPLDKLEPGLNENAFYDPAGLQLVERIVRSEEHTSELQSRPHLVCRLLLEKQMDRLFDHTCD